MKVYCQRIDTLNGQTTVTLLDEKQQPHTVFEPKGPVQEYDSDQEVVAPHFTPGRFYEVEKL